MAYPIIVVVNYKVFKSVITCSHVIVKSRQCLQDVLIAKPFHLPVVYMENGSRDRSCQHLWFSEFDFLHNGVENEALFCYTYHR